MGLLDRFKKYINGNNEDDFENMDYEIEDNEDDNILIKMENNNSLRNEFMNYDINCRQKVNNVV